MSGAEADLDAGVARAEAAGARLLEGRLRLQRRAAGVRRGDEERTAWCLQADVPWTLQLRQLPS